MIPRSATETVLSHSPGAASASELAPRRDRRRSGHPERSPVPSSDDCKRGGSCTSADERGAPCGVSVPAIGDQYRLRFRPSVLVTSRNRVWTGETDRIKSIMLYRFSAVLEETAPGSRRPPRKVIRGSRPSSSVESGASRPKRNNEQPVGLTADFGTTLAVLLESVFRRIEESVPCVRSRGVIPIFGSQTKPCRSVSSRGFDISNPSIMGPAQMTEHWAGTDLSGQHSGMIDAEHGGIRPVTRRYF